MERGILFPETGLIARRQNADSAHSTSGHELFLGPLRDRDHRMTPDLLRCLKEEIAQSGATRIVLSSEMILAPKRAVHPALVKEFLSPIGDVRPIVYLRRQDRYIQSHYLQSLGQHSLNDPVTIMEFLSAEGARAINFKKRLAPWQDLFGTDLEIRSYDDACQRPGGVPADFFASVLNLDSRPEPPPGFDAIQPSVSPDLVNLLHAVSSREDIDAAQMAGIVFELRTNPNWVYPSSTHILQRIIDFISRWTKSQPAKRLLPDEHWHQIKNQYRRWNDEMADKVISGPAEKFRFLKDELPSGDVCAQRHTISEAKDLARKSWPPGPSRRTVPSFSTIPRTAPKIGICTLLRETPDITRGFIHYHLNLGVDRFFICFDDPEDPMIDEFSNHPRIECHVCTDEFWKRHLGGPSKSLSDRQDIVRHLGRDCLISSGVDWTIFMDGDELLYGELVKVMSDVDADTNVVTLPAAEAVLHDKMPCNGVFRSTWFRRPPRGTIHDAALIRTEYEYLASILQDGFHGHRLGKSLVRSHTNIHFYDLHRPLNLRNLKMPLTTDHALLLHFAVLDFPDWETRWRHRVG